VNRNVSDYIPKSLKSQAFMPFLGTFAESMVKLNKGLKPLLQNSLQLLS